MESPSVDDLPARQESGLESPPDFLGNQETVDKELFEIPGKLSVTRGKDGTPPQRPPKRVLRLLRTV